MQSRKRSHWRLAIFCLNRAGSVASIKSGLCATIAATITTKATNTKKSLTEEER